jgi:hypothetical protein
VTAEPISITTARKLFRRDGMGWLWEIPDRNVVLRADYLGVRSDELHGEVRVTLGGRHLHLARFNLSSTSSRGTLAKALAAQTNDPAIRWDRIVEQFSVGVLEAERQGESTRYTSTAAKRRLQYLIDRMVIRGKTNMLFAPGGSGKGFLTVGLCAGVACNRGLGDLQVLADGATPFYFDWEDDFETFEDRLNTVARGMEVEVPRIAYKRMRGLVPDRINEMARAISDAGADFGIIDSFSAAGGTVSDRGSWDTIAHRLFDALDQVPGMTWLIIDHVAGDKLHDPSGKAFGSIQKMNRVRNAWEMRSDQEPGGARVHMKLFDAKWNHTGKRTAFALAMTFVDDKVTFESAEMEEQIGANSASVDIRMATQLAARPMRTDELARAIKAAESSIRSAVSRNPDRFRRDDATGMIYLAGADVPEDLPF